VYDVNHFEQKVLQQVTNEVLDNKTVYNTGEGPAMTLGVLGIEETENERKIRTGEMTPFGSTDVSQKNSKRYIIVVVCRSLMFHFIFEIFKKKIYLDLINFSFENLLEKYLVSQTKLSTMVQRPKIKISSTKKKLKSTVEIKKPIEKSNESGSEYFPSTDSGK